MKHIPVRRKHLESHLVLHGQLTAVLRAQEPQLSRQVFRVAMASQLGQLSSQVHKLLKDLRQTSNQAKAPESPVTTVAPVQATPIGGTESKLAPPERFSEEPGLCKAVVIDCSIHFEHSPHTFATGQSKILFMVSHLTGRARAWATAEWAHDSPLCSSLPEFQTALQKTFDPVSMEREKGGGSVCDYAICFRILVAENGWNATVLYDLFLKGLSAPIREPSELPPDLDSLLALAIQTDNSIHQLHQHRGGRPSLERYQHSRVPCRPDSQGSIPDQLSLAPTAGEIEPMQLSRTQLTTEE